MAEQYFEELLRSLKVELRNACNDLLYMQEYRTTLESQMQTLNRLVANQRAQIEQGNLSKSKLLRIQTEAFATGAEYNELQKEISKGQKDLRILLNLESPSYIVITESPVAPAKSPDELSYGALLDKAVASRPDVKAALTKVDYFEKSLKYEQSQAIPELALKASYDRAGGIVRNFVGFGFGIDLPFFNRNQGNIRAARANIKQSAAEAEHQELLVRHELGEALQNYTVAYNFVQQLDSDGLRDLDEMLDNYTKNFTNRNIGVVEFLDFFEAYRENRRIALEAKRNLSVCLEELKYAAGTEDL